MRIEKISTPNDELAIDEAATLMSYSARQSANITRGLLIFSAIMVAAWFVTGTMSNHDRLGNLAIAGGFHYLLIPIFGFTSIGFGLLMLALRLASSYADHRKPSSTK